MAVYTTITEAELCHLLAAYNLSGLSAFEGASEGIENTTYFVMLDDGSKFVLTLFEGLDTESLPFYASLTRVLSEAGLPVPAPLVDVKGEMVQRVSNKPTLLFPRADGSHKRDVTVIDCAEIGSTLARIHSMLEISKSALFPQSNPRGRAWFESVMDELNDRVDGETKALFTNLLVVGDRLDAQSLPTGLIHGDLFRDNALFYQGRLSAVIDFYNAGEDILLLDLAIVANDWCCCEEGDLVASKLSALKAAYASERNISQMENDAWFLLLAWAAGRFWLSRLKSQLNNEPNQKNVAQYRSILEKRLLLCGMGPGRL